MQWHYQDSSAGSSRGEKHGYVFAVWWYLKQKVFWFVLIRLKYISLFGNTDGPPQSHRFRAQCLSFLGHFLEIVEYLAQTQSTRIFSVIGAVYAATEY